MPVGIDNVVTLMLACNGVADATAAPDLSIWNSAPTFNGGAKIVASDSPGPGFGASCLQVLASGSDYLAHVDSSRWDLGNNHTIDLWVKHTTTPAGTQTYIGHYESTVHGWCLRHVAGTGIQFLFSNGSLGDLYSLAGGEITDTDWHHIAYVKESTVHKLYKDGTQVATVTDADSGGFTGPLEIGRRSTAGEYMTGKFSAIRLSKGLARWSANFTPWKEAYTRNKNMIFVMKDLS